MIESWFIPFDILRIVCNVLIIILAVCFLFIIILDKTCHTVSMILIINSCLATFIAGCSLLSLCIFTLQNDLKQIEYQDPFCIFRAYIIYLSGVLCNTSFLLQAIYRYIMIVHPTRLFCQSVRFQVLAICLTWIFALVYPIVFIFTGEIIYNVDNQICQLPLQLSFSVIYTIYCIYIIPVSMIVIIYFKLVRYVREMSKRITPTNILSRAQRELQMVRRTVTLVTIMVTACFPYSLFLILSFFNRTPKYHFRIAFVFIDVSVLLIMIVLFQFTEPLKTSLMKRINQRPNTELQRVVQMSDIE